AQPIPRRRVPHPGQNRRARKRSGRRIEIERKPPRRTCSRPNSAGGDSCDSGAGGNGAWNGRRAAHKENLAGSGGEDRMKQLAFIAALMLASAGFHPVRAQSVTLYTAGPESLAKDIAKAFGDKAGIKVEVYQATSGDVLARLEAEKAKPRADVAVLASWGEGLAVRE